MYMRVKKSFLARLVLVGLFAGMVMGILIRDLVGNITKNTRPVQNEIVYVDAFGYARNLDFKNNDFQEDPGIVDYATYTPTLPESIRKDIEYMNANDIHEIVYCLPGVNYKGMEANLNEFSITQYGRLEAGFYRNYEEISIYKNSKDNSICIYAVEDVSESNKQFVKIVYNEKNGKSEEILDKDIHIPNEVAELNNGLYNIYNIKDGEFLLGKETSSQPNKKIYLYKNKKKIAETDFPDSNADSIRNAIITETGYYYIFAGANAKIPWIKVEQAFSGMDGATIPYYVKDDNASFPILKGKDGKYYSVQPNNKEDFVLCRLYNSYEVTKNENEVDTSLNIICLNDMLTKIEFLKPREDFISSEYTWTVKFYFGKDLYVEDTIDGIDNGEFFSLQKAEIEELAKTVYTMDEYWENVERIRKTYEQYYKHKK